MPTFQGNIVSVDNGGQPTWQSPDGQRKLWSVTVEANNRQARCKTYSQQIATVGFAGQIEAYEKANNQGGVDTFLKKPQQEGYQNTTAPTTAPAGGARSSYQPKDEAAIKAMWAIGQAVGEAAKAEGATSMASIEHRAVQFFHMVDRVKVAPDVEDLTQQNPAIGEPNPNELNAVFGPTTFDDGSGPHPWQSQ